MLDAGDLATSRTSNVSVNTVITVTRAKDEKYKMALEYLMSGLISSEDHREVINREKRKKQRDKSWNREAEKQEE